jgi:transposase
MSREQTRYVAFDVHKSYVMVAAVNADQEVVLSPRKVSFSRFEDWIARHLKPSDEVVLEATTNAWHLYDQLEPWVKRVVVAHPYHIKVIAAAVVKTDKRDTLNLARLLAAKMVPEVWVPPVVVRDLRALIAHRRRLVSQQTAAKNRLHSVLHRHNIVPPGGKLFGQENRQWWQELELLTSEKLRVRQDLATLAHLRPQLDEVKQELTRLSTIEPWAGQVTYLIQLPGFGLITVMTILSAIGDVQRFPSAKKLVGYAGLGSKVHASGQTHYGGPITKQGRRELRSGLVEAAWTAVRYDPHWQAKFETLKARIGQNKAIVAIARRLLVVVWHVLSACQADRKADADKVAGKLMLWAWQLGQPRRHNLSTGQFIRYHLLKLNLGNDLDFIVRGGVKRLISPPEEVLERYPDLHSSD